MAGLFHVGLIAENWDNTRIGPTRSQDIALSYDHSFRAHLRFHAEVFQQHLLDVPLPDTSSFAFLTAPGTSQVNGWDSRYGFGLAQRGQANNQGVELSFAHNFHNGFFYQVNTTLFTSTFTDAYGNSYSTRWNNTLLGNAMLGKEFAKQKEHVKRTWGVNTRANVMGGQHYTANTVSAGEVAVPYAAQFPTYYRIDLRVYLKREHTGRTGMWALDLQNATNAQNEAYRYYDRRKNEVVTKYQLGLIPNLSYRIEF